MPATPGVRPAKLLTLFEVGGWFGLRAFGRSNRCKQLAARALLVKGVQVTDADLLPEVVRKYVPLSMHA